MKVILYMTTTVDGYVAKTDGDSDWVSPVDEATFNQMIDQTGCIMVGRKTFDQYHGDLYPVEDISNIVLTSDHSATSSEEGVYFVHSAPEAIEKAKELGHEEVLLIGGGITNGLFLEKGLINEIYLTIHPLVFGQGIRLFEGVGVDLKLKLVSQQKLAEDLLRVYYQVIK